MVSIMMIVICLRILSSTPSVPMERVPLQIIGPVTGDRFCCDADRLYAHNPVSADASR